MQLGKAHQKPHTFHHILMSCEMSKWIMLNYGHDHWVIYRHGWWLWPTHDPILGHCYYVHDPHDWLHGSRPQIHIGSWLLQAWSKWPHGSRAQHTYWVMGIMGMTSNKQRNDYYQRISNNLVSGDSLGCAGQSGIIDVQKVSIFIIVSEGGRPRDIIIDWLVL